MGEALFAAGNEEMVAIFVEGDSAFGLGLGSEERGSCQEVAAGDLHCCPVYT